MQRIQNSNFASVGKLSAASTTRSWKFSKASCDKYASSEQTLQHLRYKAQGLG